MPTKEECDDYAVTALEQFDAFVRWSIIHWPDQHAPLTSDDFHAGRRELSALLGARLNATNNGEIASINKEGIGSPSVGPSDPSEQYVNMNPAPWP